MGMTHSWTVTFSPLLVIKQLAESWIILSTIRRLSHRCTCLTDATAASQSNQISLNLFFFFFNLSRNINGLTHLLVAMRKASSCIVIIEKIKHPHYFISTLWLMGSRHSRIEHRSPSPLPLSTTHDQCAQDVNGRLLVAIYSTGRCLYL